MNRSLVLEKAIAFALRIVKLYKYLTEEKKEYVLSKQVLIAGTYYRKARESSYASRRSFRIYRQYEFCNAEGIGNRVLVADPEGR